MKKTQDIRIRDPYIVAYNGKYYMYSSTNTEQYADGLALLVYESTDLENWSDPKVAFNYIPSETTPIKDQLWATEVHLYKGKFYAFMSFLNDKERKMRGTYTAVSEKPDGPFSLLSDKPVTPYEQSCIDGTLFVENDVPYVVYSRDWPHTFVESANAYVGSIWAVKLDDELKGPVGEPFRLFESWDDPLSKNAPNDLGGSKGRVRYGSDAPFVTKLKSGKLFLTWSPMLDENYVVLGAVSDSGKIKGPWRHLDKPVFDENGGHAMFFDALDGRKMMCIHKPERPPEERMYSCEVVEDTEKLTIK